LHLAFSAKTSFVLTLAFKGALLIWAGEEIVRGVNPWRRCLGAAVEFPLAHVKLSL
jgi:hypothetical protein